ncbi:tape measure protein [Larkinella punicea]|uniref:Tape measure protein N-terminal domain-containing protein n=1 Tax=Larkinella punicea TaxID=2315727 RepID=A0A368JKX0_9BACT|nr:tape measure protein [Larkinella punicea]RCR68309.1 hypothetical protein DUE52_18105 [Larkinella punicea]
MPGKNLSTQTLSVELEAKLGNWSSNLEKAQSKLEQFAARAEKAGQTLSVSLSAPLGFLVKKMSDAFGQSDSMARGLATLEKNADTLQARLAHLNEIAKMPGLSFEGAVEGDIKLRTVLESIYGIQGAAEKSSEIMKQFGNSLAVEGKGKEAFDRVLHGIQQMSNTEFPLGEDLNIITEAASKTVPILKEAFGSSRAEDLRKMGITSKQVMETMLKGLEKLPRASGGWKNALENMGTAGKKAMADVFGSIDKVMGLTGLMDRLSGIITSMAERFQTLSPNVQRVIAVLGGLAIVVPPLLVGLGFLTSTILPAIGAGFAAIFSPIGLVVAAVALAVAAVVMHWDKVKAALVNSGAWDKLKTIVKSVLGIVVSIFGVFANLLQGDWGALWESFLNILKNSWNLILSYVALGLNGMNKLISKGLRAIGANSLADPFDKASKTIDDYLKKLKYDVPDATGKIKNLFDGLNFGGNRDDKILKTGGGGGKGKGKEADTWAERMRKDLKAVDDLIKEFEAKNPGKIDPSLTFMKMQKGWIQDQLGINEKTDLPSSTDIGPVKSAAQRYWEAISKGWLTPMERAFNTRKSDVGRMFSDVHASIAASMNSVTARLAGGISWPEIEGRLTTMLAGTKDAVAKYQKMAGDLMRLPEGERAAALQSWQDFSTGVSEILKQGMQSAFEGIGEMLGQILTKSAGIQALPQMLLGVIGGMAIQLGKLAIGIGIASEGIKKAFTSLGGVGAIAAGVALIALGTVAKAGAAKIGNSAPALAKGGLAFGPTMAMIGDNPRANVDPEVVAPLSKLKSELGGGNGQRVQVYGQMDIGPLAIALKEWNIANTDQR